MLEKYGRHSARLIEPQGLTVLREYAVAWKKQTYDIAELEKLRFVESLTLRQITARLGIPRTTAIDAVHRLEKARSFR